MTDAERLKLLHSAKLDLTATKQGFVQWDENHTGSHWPDAMRKLQRLEADLLPNPVPALGPVIRGGKSLLNVSLTHNTDGIPLYPAFDDGWAAGRLVIAPEALTVISPYTSSNPGAAFYARGASTIRYWFGHLTRSPRIGTKFAKGQEIGAIAAQSTPHIHTGINVELLLGSGKQLLYGSSGHGPDYTTGAPTVGAQLRKSMT